MIQILLSVEEGGTPLSTLREITGSTSQALIPKIRKLESLSLVESRGPGYGPTILGTIVAQKIGDFSLTIGTLTTHNAFWKDHDISTIPWPLLERIGDLLNSEIACDTGTDIMHVYYRFLQLLRDAKQIAGVSAMMNPGLAEMLSQRVIEGIPVDLLVNPETIEQLQREPYISLLTSILKFDNFNLWVTDRPIGFGLTVTESAISIGFNRRDLPIYDISTDLFSWDPAAISWGRALFDKVREDAVPFTGF